VSEETSLWKGSPSQWLNLWVYVIAGLLIIAIGVAGFFTAGLALIGLILPLAWILWRYLSVRCRTFELTTERLKITEGVINQHLDEVELYRVKDVLMMRPWWMRVTGLATLFLETSDRSLPTLTIPAIRNGLELREQLRKHVELQRDRKRVRETDFDDSTGDLIG
jgi:uncharacterized membrane protein YdbT with pleckstrin-like domain